MDEGQGRRVAAVVALLLAAAAVVAIVVAISQSGSGGSRGPNAHASSSHSATGARRPATPAHAQGTQATKSVVGLRVLRLVDASRTITLPDGTTAPRTLVTYVRYPALASSKSHGGDVVDAPPARAVGAGGSYPLVIFGHGFAVTPAIYAPLLRAWARAGFVVAAPVFPLGNANAPGGPNESDLPNQPADMSFVITRLLAASAGTGPLAGLIDAHSVAVSGQSDGGDTALAAAYDSLDRDPRIGAAVILSGAEIPGVSGFTFPPGEPPLLAVQGTADTINPPELTETFFSAARAPKFLLTLPGAEHLPPYTTQQPQLSIIERVTIAFLDAYLKHAPSALQHMLHAGEVPGVATMTADP